MSKNIVMYLYVILFLGPRYEVVAAKKTWAQAEQHCQRMGGHLVTVTSQKLDNELLRRMKAK